LRKLEAGEGLALGIELLVRTGDGDVFNIVLLLLLLLLQV
jgi:hypothetical protein